MTAYAGEKCEKCSDQWTATPTSTRLWVTSRDGDVVLVTTGDGQFASESE